MLQGTLLPNSNENLNKQYKYEEKTSTIGRTNGFCAGYYL